MSRPLPLLDLGPMLDALGPEIERVVGEVLRSGRFILGPNVEAFEREVGEFLEVEHAVTLANGTDALVIALEALGVRPGDEVIVPSFTFFATVEAVSRVGATPVFVDVEPDTFCISARTVEPAIGTRTRAIVPVHLFGHPVDLDPLLELARAHGARVLEDAAQAFGARDRGRRVGGIGDAGTFSFYPTKNLGAFGDAGLLVTNDADVADRARLLRSHGERRRYEHEMLGYNSRTDEIQAAILRVKLPWVDRWNRARREVAHAYTERLAGLDGVEPPAAHGAVEHVYHQYTVRVPERERDAIRQRLEKDRIASIVYYAKGVHELPMYAQQLDLPETARACRQVLSLPIWPELDVESIQRVADRLGDR